MRKSLLAGLALFSLSSVTAVNNASLKPSFAEATWYSNRSSVKAQLIKRGYNYISSTAIASTTDDNYTGKVNGNPISLREWFNNKNQLVKTTLVFNSTSGLYPLYTTVKDNLMQKYGAGNSISEDPLNYKSYDSLLFQGILDGSVNYRTLWVFPQYNFAITLEITKPYTNSNEIRVLLSYESPTWSNELDRRNNGGDF